MIQPGPPPRRRNRTLVVGLVLLLAGFLGGVGVGVKAVGGFAGALDVRELTVPVKTSLRLTADDYAVYQRVGTTTSDTGTSTGTPAPSLSADLVTVTGPGGAAVPVRGRTALSENVTVNGVVYVAFAYFTAPADGTYDVQVAGGDGADGAVVTVKRTLGSAFSGALPWIGLGALAGILVVVGLVVTLVGAVRGRRPATPVPAAATTWPGAAASGASPGTPAGTPPGWYPDPDAARPGGTRWWDGSRWTDHTR